jgi:hypothetical protein
MGLVRRHDIRERRFAPACARLTAGDVLFLSSKAAATACGS